MTNNSKQDDFPTIRLEEEDRRPHQNKKQPVNAKPAENNAPESHPAPVKKSFPFTALLSLLIASAACGGCYYLYDLNQKQSQAFMAAEARIVELESKLSATDEEMGESTVALQVKVNELTEKTTELWEQMDKLWASAWRRNQKEITDLAARVSNIQNNLQESINQVSRNTSSQQTKIVAVENQLSILADEILAVNVQLEQSSAAQQSAIQQSKNLEEKLAVIEKRNNALNGRLNNIEDELKAIATRLVSRTSTPKPTTVKPVAPPPTTEPSPATE